MTGFMIFFIVAALIGVIVVVIKIIFIGFVITKGVQWYANSFEKAMREQEQLLQQLAAGRQATPQIQANFMGAFMRAQNEMRHLDGLRQQQAELRMADMKSQAASMGLFL